MLRLAVPFMLLAAAPAAAVLITSTPGAPDPGIPHGQTMLVSFDTPPIAGVTNVTSGPVITAAGSIGGVRAAPAGTGDGVYQSIDGGGSSLFDFSGFTQGKPLASLSLYWGSVDGYNFIDFLNKDGVRIGGTSGSSLPLANGNQSDSITNRRVVFNFSPREAITAVRLRSDSAAFEFDSLAGTAAVPEPAVWALLIVGFGMVGHAMRKRRMAKGWA
jgi:hypothetical protein